MDEFVAYARLVPGTLTPYDSDDNLRISGAFAYPRNAVAIANVDEHPSYPGALRRIGVSIVSTDPSSPAYGMVTEQDALLYTQGSPDMRGMASTSFFDEEGNIDGLLLAIDRGCCGWPNTRVFSVTVEGEVSQGGISAASVVSGISSTDANPTVLPGVDFGYDGEEGRIFLAYVRDGEGSSFIDVGFLTRSGQGFDFELTDSVETGSQAVDAAGEPVEGESYDFSGCTPFREIGVAFDANRNEFGVGWACDGFIAYAQRFDWNGQHVGARLQAHFGAPEALHAGSTMAFNRESDRYVFGFQHNSASLEPDASGSFSCIQEPTSQGNCVNTTAYGGDPCHLIHGGRWAVVEDYVGEGSDFRMAGVSSAAGEGDMLRLNSGAVGTSCVGSGADWVYEDQVWPSGERYNEAHSYVRAPQGDTLVTLFSSVDTSDKWSEVRCTLSDASSGYEFWE